MSVKIFSIDGIDKPRFKVSPSRVVVWFCLAIVLMLYLSVLNLEYESVTLKWVVIVSSSIFLLGLFKQVLRKDHLVTLVANHNGLYFLTDKQREYYFVRWNNVLNIEKTIFPLSQRGIRFEVSIKASGSDLQTKLNISEENGKLYIYTIPQLMNRENLIRKLESFWHNSMRSEL